MQQVNKLANFLIMDFLLYMESGKYLPHLCRTPQVNRFVFDVLIKGYHVDKSNIKFDAAGPLQVTNIFIKEYLDSATVDDAADMLEMFVEINQHFASIPLYQIKSVCGFLNRLDVVQRSIKNPDINSDLSIADFRHSFVGHNPQSFYSTIYSKYFGAMSSRIGKRISQYIELSLEHDGRQLFVDAFSSESSWNV